MTSFYFEDLFERYAAEIDDLSSDSEGRDVLKKRVREKHKEFGFLLSMMDTAPEMVAPAFHGAFTFRSQPLVYGAAHSEPGEDDFPAWSELARTLDIAPWAEPLVAQCLARDGGDSFLVTAAVLEHMLGSGIKVRAAPDTARDDEEQDEDLGDSFAEYHEEAAWLLLGLIGVHAAAALFHHYVKRDNVLRAMLPAALARRR